MPQRFPHLHYKNGDLFLEDVSLATLANTYGTPLYVYSWTMIEEQIKRLQAGLRGLDSQLCYAVKANSNLSLLKKFSQLGLGLDLVSGGELFRAEKVAFPAERIVFSGVGKTEKEIKQALTYLGRAIQSLHVESVEELHFINQIAKELAIVANICLRYNPNVDPKTHPYISTGLHRNKFGLNREEIISVAREMKNLAHVEFHGLSIHIGSQILDLSPFQEAYEDVLSLAQELKQTFNIQLKVLDLGGGLGVGYRPGEEGPSIEDYTALIQKCFSGEGYKILLEPGRSLVANSGILLTQVLFRKPRKERDFLIVDASMAELVRPCLYEAYHDIWPLKFALAQGPKKTTDIVGPVCESSDFLALDREFPIDLKKGDLLAVLSAGAYGFSMSGQFNSRPRVAEVLIEKKSVIEIRKRESFEDLINGEKF